MCPPRATTAPTDPGIRAPRQGPSALLGPGDRPRGKRHGQARDVGACRAQWHAVRTTIAATCQQTRGTKVAACEQATGTRPDHPPDSPIAAGGPAVPCIPQPAE